MNDNSYDNGRMTEERAEDRIVPIARGARPVRVASSLLTVLLTFLLTGASADAQEDLWRFDSLESTVGFDNPFSFNPHVQFDRWGILHYAWATRDPNSAGLQVHYSNDETMLVGAPFLMTDTGTVYDSLSVDTLSFRTLVDREGFVHTTFVANVPGPNGLEIGLYYASNRIKDFLETPARLLTLRSARHALAVDSTGTPHVVWLEQEADSLLVRYWSEGIAAPKTIGTVPCRGPAGARSDPGIEAAAGHLEVFVRNDSGSVWRGRYTPSGPAVTFMPLPIGPYPPLVVPRLRIGDLSLRTAIDGSGTVHLLIPRREPNGQVSLLRATVSGTVTTVTTLAALDTTLLGYALASDGADRIAATWTSYRGRFPADRPMVGYAEYRRSGGSYSQTALLPDLNAVVGNPTLEWREANRVTIHGDRVEIIGPRYASNRAQRRLGLFSRLSTGPRTTLLLPDAAAPGMDLVVETFAPALGFGSFGPDGHDPSAVALELVDPADSARVVIGPSVVSWSGRLLSTMIFLKPDAAPGPVELHVRRGTATSNPQTFQIVQPQRLGPNGSGRLSGGGVLGSGGAFGTRSARGVMVVDTLRLSNGVYTASTADTDPATPGTQGMLPLIILARGSIIIDSTATLSVSAPSTTNPAEYGTAGVGGGGGGGGMGAGGGIGYTAGGVPSDSVMPYPGVSRAGSGSDRSGQRTSGGALTGTRGGDARPHVPSGGGTGHPFGASGRYGRLAPLLPIEEDPGGFGGGTGGSILETGFTSGGGGGGYGTAGDRGGALSDNGGAAIGSRVLVPLAGGSGGGGAWSAGRGRSGGGGGGGGLALYAERTLELFGLLRADGGEGTTDLAGLDRSGGGGGSGGGVLIGAQGGIILGRNGGVSVAGGKGGQTAGPQGSKGGDGGIGRVRVDGRIDTFDSTVVVDRLSSGYFGAAADMSGSFQAERGTTITGSGVPGRTVRIYVRPEHGVWSYDLPRDVVIDTAGVWSVPLDNDDADDGLLYVAMLEKVPDPSSDRWLAVPSWVMSTAGGAVVGRPGIAIDSQRVDFGCVAYDSCKTATISVTNTGTQSDLFLREIKIIGAPGVSLVGETSGMRIPPGTTGVIRLRFCPQGVDDITGELRLTTNVRPDSIVSIPLAACGRSGRLGSDESVIDIGALCPGACRDTVVRLTNDGDADLRVTDLLYNTSDLSVLLIDDQLPITIARGASRDLRLRICLNGGSGDNILAFRATTPFPSHSIIIRATNVGPVFTLPARRDAGTIDLGRGDSCRAVDIVLRNRATDRELRVENIVLDDPRFTLIAPQGDTAIAANDSITLRLLFCGDSVVTVSARLALRLGSAGCTVDTAMMLDGRIVRSTPSLSLTPTKKIDFGSTPVGQGAAPQEIRIVNSGLGTARGIRYRIVVDSPTGPNEVDLVGTSSPFDLAGTSFEPLSLTMIPGAVGVRSGRLIVEADLPVWSDTVEFCVNGIAPGITADTLLLDMGLVRIGSGRTRGLRFFNRGSADDDLTGIELVDSTRFALLRLQYEGNNRALPITLRPELDTLAATIEFRPNVVGPIVDTLIGVAANGAPVRVLLSGIGAVERAVPEQDVMRFACAEDEDAIRTVTIRNEGNWPLTIVDLLIEGRDSAAFEPLDTPAPDQLEPGERISYRILYRGSASDARALLRVMQSGPEQVTVQLEGEGCASEEIDLSFTMPTIEAPIGTVVMIPLSLEIDRPLDYPLPFTLHLRYEPTVIGPAPEAPTPGVGTIVIDEEEPGEMTITGTLPRGAGSGIVAMIPMKVYLGVLYTTPLDLRLDEERPFPATFRPLLKDGTLTAVDCDTLGTIDLGGVYGIKQSTPNPAGATVTIDFEIARRELVRITLFDALGVEVALLLDRTLDRGAHQLTFPTQGLGAGLYYYEIVSGRYREVGRMVVGE